MHFVAIFQFIKSYVSKKGAWLLSHSPWRLFILRAIWWGLVEACGIGVGGTEEEDWPYDSADDETSNGPVLREWLWGWGKEYRTKNRDRQKEWVFIIVMACWSGGHRTLRLKAQLGGGVHFLLKLNAPLFQAALVWLSSQLLHCLSPLPPASSRYSRPAVINQLNFHLPAPPHLVFQLAYACLWLMTAHGRPWSVQTLLAQGWGLFLWSSFLVLGLFFVLQKFIVSVIDFLWWRERWALNVFNTFCGYASRCQCLMCHSQAL